MKDDTISRAAAIDAFLTELTKRERKNFLHTWSTVEVKYFVADMLEKLPPAQPVEDIHREKEQAYYCGYEDGAKAARSAQPGWIPVSEKLPEEDTEVLVTVYFMGLKQTSPSGWNDHIKPSYYVDIASRIGDDWCSASDEYKVARNRHKVIAWVPLPKPYTGKDGDGNG
jgi:hypothetical protein